MNAKRNTAHGTRKLPWLLLCVLILGAGVGAFMLLGGLRPEPVSQARAPVVPTVETVPLSYRQSPLVVRGSGVVRPTAEAGIAAQVSGKVISANPKLVSGGSFEAGEVMLQIERRSFEASLAEARANKAVTESNLALINKQIERLESLRSRSFTSEQSLDEALSQREQARANIDRLEAVIDTRRLDLERTTITAPFNGRVLSENVDVGDIVSPGTELARFYASDAVEIIVSLTPDDASLIPGLWQRDDGERRPAGITVAHGGAEYRWEGHLDRVEADMDATTRTIDVVVRIPDPFRPGEPESGRNSQVHAELESPPPLLVGMYADVAIEGMRLPRHFTLPMSAVRRDDTIWIVDVEGRLSIEDVEVVRREGETAVLLAPQLIPGDRIITSDLAVASDGMQIEVRQDQSENTYQ